MSSYETVNLVRSAVDNARQGMQQSLEGSERVGEAVKLKLTVDLGHKGIEMLPEEVVQILKRDVERYAPLPRSESPRATQENEFASGSSIV